MLTCSSLKVLSMTWSTIWLTPSGLAGRISILCVYPPLMAEFLYLTDDYKVAAAKGLICGPVDLILRRGNVVSCSLPPDGVRAFRSGKLNVSSDLDHICSRSCSPTLLRLRKWTFMAPSGCWLSRKRCVAPLHLPEQLLMMPRQLSELWQHRNTQRKVSLDRAS